MHWYIHNSSGNNINASEIHALPVMMAQKGGLDIM